MNGGQYELLKPEPTSEELKPFAIIWRKKGEFVTDPCPFCGKRHEHGRFLDGHRIVHCNKPLEFIASDGTLLESKDGYVIREY